MEWISVEDRLPDDSGRYLIFLQGSVATSMETARYCVDTGKWRAAQSLAVFENVTHWTALPEPPQVKETTP